MLEVKNLHVRIGDAEILKGVNLKIAAGQVHAIMGPNGSGKSTLAKAVAGHPGYEITRGEILFNGQAVDEAPELRALKGIFLGFQYPVEIPGVNNASFLRMAYNAKRKYHGQEEVDPLEFDAFLAEKMKVVEIHEDFKSRDVNSGFSGGEKKKNEILQMAVLEPRLAILDETDSGLDIDALRIVATGINRLKSIENAVLLITHYQRLLNYVEPHFVHVMSGGRIVKSGDKRLAIELEEKGYDWLVRG